MKTLRIKLGSWYNRWWKAVLICLLAMETYLLIFPMYQDVPEPKICALCGGFRYHAPCLVRLDTGEVGELQVYDPDPTQRGEISDRQQTGTFSLLHCAGLLGTRDTCSHTTSVDLTEKAGKLAQEYFCLDCRALLAETAKEGYVLADLYDLENIQIYAVRNGKKYSIRDYEVTVEYHIYQINQRELCVKVVGQL